MRFSGGVPTPFSTLQTVEIFAAPYWDWIKKIDFTKYVLFVTLESVCHFCYWERIWKFHMVLRRRKPYLNVINQIRERIGSTKFEKKRPLKSLYNHNLYNRKLAITNVKNKKQIMNIGWKEISSNEAFEIKTAIKEIKVNSQIHKIFWHSTGTNLLLYQCFKERKNCFIIPYRCYKAILDYYTKKYINQTDLINFLCNYTKYLQNYYNNKK